MDRPLIAAIGGVIFLALTTLSACGQASSESESQTDVPKYKVTCLFNGQVETHFADSVYVDRDGTWIGQSRPDLIRYSPVVPCKRELYSPPVPAAGGALTPTQ